MGDMDDLHLRLREYVLECAEALENYIACYIK